MNSSSRLRYSCNSTQLTARAAALAVLVSAWAGGCGEDQKPTGEPDATGALSGTLQNLVADFDDGHTERYHYLEVSGPTGDRSMKLLFAGEPTLDSGDKLRVWGTTTPENELQVARYEIVSSAADDIATVRSTLTTVTPKQNKNAFVLVDLGGGVNVTAAAANTSVFSPGTNFANVYNILSYGSMNYVGDVLGPFSYSMTTCDYNGLRTAVKAMITTGTYDHYMWSGNRCFSAFRLGREWVGVAEVPSSLEHVDKPDFIGRI